MAIRKFSITPTYAVEYLHFDADERSTRQQYKPPIRTGTRLMSKQSKKNLVLSLQWLKLFTPHHRIYCKDQKKMITFRINFITLTLSEEQKHPDAYIKKHMLDPFLKWLARKGANTYIWKAEAQNNGNLHFHITTNHYIYWRDIRNKWNQLQQDNGYLDNYHKEHGHSDANSTDIHAVKRDAQIGAYIGKYMGKLELWCKVVGEKMPFDLLTHPSRLLEEYTTTDKPMPIPKRQIEGRKWSQSNNLTNLKCVINETSKSYYQDTVDFIINQDYTKCNVDFADLWFFPHILESNAPKIIVDKLAEMKQRVDSHND